MNESQRAAALRLADALDADCMVVGYDEATALLRELAAESPGDRARAHADRICNAALAQDPQAEPVMFNGLTEAETNATASVAGLTQAEPVATYSPCCKIIRLGIHGPYVMHSGNCRDRRADRTLGPTLFLYADPRAHGITEAA